MPDQNPIYNDPEFQKLSADRQQAVLRSIGENVGKETVGGMLEKRRSDGMKDTALEFLRPILSSLAGAGGGVAGAPAGPVGAGAGAAAAYTAVDAALQHLESKPPQSISSEIAGFEPGSIPDTLTNTAQQAAVGKVIGGVVNKGMKTVKGLMNVGKAPIAGTIHELDPTFSQAVAPSRFQTFTQWMEDKLAPGAKTEALEASGGKANELFKKMNFTASGNQSNVNAGAPHAMLQNIADKYETQILRLNDAADDAANTVRTIAKANTLPSGMGGLPVLTAGPLGRSGGTVGPVGLLETARRAQSYLLEQQKHFMGSAGIPEAKKEAINEAQAILKNLGAQIDPQGNVIGVQNIGFDQAWEIQKAVGNVAFKRGGTGELSNIYHAMGDDIEQSIGSWKNDPAKTALSAFRASKAAAAMKFEMFKNPDKAPTITAFLDNTRSDVPVVNEIVNTPKMLREAIAGSKISIPTPTGATTLSDVKAKEALSGYALDSIRRNNFTPSVMNPNIGTFDAPGILQKWNDPLFQESKKLMFSAAQRGNFDQLFKNISMVSQKASPGSVSPMMWLARAGFAAAPILVTGAMHNYQVSGMAVSGAILTGAAMAKLMANPNTARYLIAAANGAPLGASQQFVGKQVANVLHGTMVGMMNGAGQTEWGELDKEGKWEPRQ